MKVAVFFGGVSNENEVSVITGTLAMNVLKKGGTEVVPVYIAQDGTAYTGDALCDIKVFKNGGYTKAPRALVADGGVYVRGWRGRLKKFIKVDAALNCCHGGEYEGGALNGVCAAAGIPLAGAGMFESSAFMNKYLTKTVLAGLKVKTADAVYVCDLENVNSIGDMADFPLIVKPVGLGSSIGVQRADGLQELRDAVQTALIYDGGAIIEKYFADRREINCAAYFSDGSITVSECEESLGNGDILSFEDKYQGGGKSIYPADIPPETSRHIKNITYEVYQKLNMRGIVRFDFILSGGEVYLSEVNTVPGSLAYYLLSKGFKNFYPVLESVIIQAVCDFKAQKSKKIICTGILKNLPAIGAKPSAK